MRNVTSTRKIEELLNKELKPCPHVSAIRTSVAYTTAFARVPTRLLMMYKNEEMYMHLFATYVLPALKT